MTSGEFVSEEQNKKLENKPKNALEELYGYELPEKREAFVDVEKGEVVDKKDISPLEMIIAIANRQGVKLNLTVKGCKICYDRKYIGFDSNTHAPVPCPCLFRGRSPEQKMADSTAWATYSFNRHKRRMMKKGLKKLINASALKQLNQQSSAENPELVENSIPDGFPTDIEEVKV